MGVSLAPVNTKNIPGDNVSFRWRQNIINVKVFLMVVGNEQHEPPRDPQSMATEGGGRRGGGGSVGQRLGSVMSICIFLLRKHVCFRVTQRVGKPEFSTLICYGRCTGV